jgi:hypothetical protein
MPVLPAFAVQSSVNGGHAVLLGNTTKTMATSGYSALSTDTAPPAAPTGLAATAGEGQITVSWKANTENDLWGYRIYRTTTNDATQAFKLANLLQDNLSYIDRDVSAGTTYYYWVSAYDTTDNEGAMTGPVSAAEKPPILFNDVPASHWANAYIAKLFSKGIISGYSDGSFSPAASVTRAEFAKMVCFAMDYMLDDPAKASFSDVPYDNWAYRYIETAKSRGVITGYTDGTFGPNKKITRAEITKVIAEVLGLSPGTSSLKDINKNWASDYITACVKAGIVSGYADGTFRPANTATRAEAVKIIARLVGE